MDRFSERMGLRAPKAIQITSMDEELKNRLWNVLHNYFWKRTYSSGSATWPTHELTPILDLIWGDFLKLPIDSRPSFWELHGYKGSRTLLRDWFEAASWDQVYELLEFIAPFADQLQAGGSRRLVTDVNRVLETENSGYRFVSGTIAPISDPVELAAIEIALSSSHIQVRTHIQVALERMSDRESPDYRNSIKESISAVEFAAKVIAQEDGGTLASVLPQLQERLHLHPAWVKGLSAIYGYMSDADGIRHNLKGESRVTVDDARFWLVFSSALAHFLLRLNETADSEQ